MQHLQNELPNNASQNEIDQFTADAKKLREITVTEFRAARSSLIFAGSIYGDSVNKLAADLLIWNNEQEIQRANLHVPKWIPLVGYENRFATILKPIFLINIRKRLCDMSKTAVLLLLLFMGVVNVNYSTTV